MANATFKLCTKGPVVTFVAVFRGMGAGLGWFARLIEPPHKYRPERHYMRGPGPKSRSKLRGHSSPE